MEDIVLTKKLIETIKELSNDLNNKTLEEFSNKLQEKSEKHNINYNVLLELVLNKEKLHDLILDHTLKFDKEIDQLEKRIEILKEDKYQMGSLLCELYGHDYGEGEYCDAVYCKNCGKRTILRGPEASKYYRKLNRTTTPIYTKPEKSR